MPTQCSRDLFGFAPVEGRRVEAAFDGGDATSDAGALLLGATDRAIGLVDRFAACFEDGRTPALVEHSVAAMVAQRVFGIALGYEDLVDHDQLRHDPVLATLAGKLQARRKDCAPLAGKSTLNRLEHAPIGPSRYHRIGHDGTAIERLFIDLFLEAHRVPPRQIVLDLDATDDPLHGHQEGRFFHGYYDCYCYLPLYVFCGSQLLAAKLRRSNIDASAGAVEEVARIVGQIRARWSRVEILAKGGAIRRFADFAWRTVDSWSRTRRVVAKAEHLPKGSNPRFVVTSLAISKVDARTLYEDIYCARGEVENRIKELQLDLFADRTSAATMRANQLRLWFASFAYVLLDALRRIGLRHTQFATATCGTIRLKLLKIGAQVRLSVRRIKVAMASACPYQAEYHLAYLYLRRAAF
jgi:hypothetical protein